MNNDTEIILAGCAPVPLAAYLKALGVLRLVVEQGADPNARGRWCNEHFVLRTALSGAALVEFFLERYAPTPVIAPWNGGSGFFPKDNKDGIAPLRDAKAPRFHAFRDTIGQVDALLADHGIGEKPEKESKARLLQLLRAVLPDDALEWLDAVVVLGSDNPRYPPLLGTGGNDGRLDFTNNFMQRLVELFDANTGKPSSAAEELLRAALFADIVAGMGSAAIGQFSPGAAGGPNAVTGFDGGSLVNPWDFVLMLEGAMLFAASTSRRLESGVPATASYPFTVFPTGAGNGSTTVADEAPARAEMWMPLWEGEASLDELRALMAEGRVTLGRRNARDGLDFARAVAKMGINRGITAFQRYGFMMRSGRAYLATPLTRLQVRRNPQADLVDELDQSGWLNRFRAKARAGSNRANSLARRLEDAIFDLAAHPVPAEIGGMSSAARVQKVLSVLAAVQHYLATTPKVREELPPVPRLNHQWVRAADDRSDEFRIAAALAGIHADALPKNAYGGNRGRDAMPMAVHMAPVHPRERARWDPGSRLSVWGGDDLYENLAQVLQRRLVEAERLPLTEKPLFGGVSADLSAVAALLAGECDAGRIAELVVSLSLCQSPAYLPRRERIHRPLPLPFLLLKPLFVPDPVLRDPRVGILPNDGSSRLPLPRAIPRLLANGRTAEALKQGIQRLRGSGVPVIPLPEAGSGSEGRRLLAALVVPLRPEDLKELYERTNKLRHNAADHETTNEGQLFTYTRR